MNKKGIALSIKNGRKIITNLGFYKNIQTKNFKDLLQKSIQRFQNKPAFRFKSNKNIINKSYIEFGNDINALGTALHKLGLKNKKIAVISENRYEWAVSFFSVVNGTGVAVPLDKHLPEVEIEKLINRGKVDAIFYSMHFDKKMLEISKKDTTVQHFICMDELQDNYPSNFTSLQELIKKGQYFLEQGERNFIDAEVDAEKLSILLFTSGTTNMSKGVMLNQRNICADVSSIASCIKALPEDVHLSILPLHHTFELSIGMMFMINNGVCIAYCEGIKHIAQNLKDFNISVIVVVPAILEAIYKKMQEGIKKSGKEKGVRFLYKLSNTLMSIGLDLRRTLFKKILAQVGPYLRLVVLGAAPTDKEIIIGFRTIGINVMQGYGLTETSPVVAANNDFYNKPGTVGHPVKGIEIAIDNPDNEGMGEIITKGQNIMLGYYEDGEATREAIDSEGWFHTGDLGVIDDEGFITITGRAKSMIVLTNGKKAFPEEYEVLLNDIEGVKESFVWGNIAPDGDIQICAKLVINDETIKEKYGDNLSHNELADIMQKEIKKINQDIPQYKIIRYFVISYESLIKTTTLKIKRPDEFKKTMEILERADTNMRKANGINIDKI